MNIDGVKIRNLEKNVDERGFFSEIIRFDWQDLFHEEIPIQFNYVQSEPGTIRAWHKHHKGQVDYFICIEGAIKLCAYDDEVGSQTREHLQEIILSSEKLSIVRIPGKLWHGYKALGNKQVKVLYGVTKLYDYSDPDEERRPWDDENIIPKAINGSSEDPRAGKPWDWQYPPHR